MGVLAFVAISIGAVASTMSGSLLALRVARHVGVVIAAGAGIRIGAAFFDLVPEAVAQLGGALQPAMAFTALGFLAFYTLEKVTVLHVGHETATELEPEDATHRHVGLIGATGMSVHSFLDGVALAAGLTVGGGLGLVIAVVVVVHRFSDGIGIASLLLASHVPRRAAYRWVVLVALAPVVGAGLGLLLPMPEAVLGALLATFAGFFLYIGAAELLPEAHRAERSMWVTIATLAGVAAIFVFSLLLGEAHP